MTSKNSFLVSMKENNKRRIWLWLVSVLSFLIVLPAFVGISFSRTLSNATYYLESLGTVLGEQMIEQMLLEQSSYLLSVRNEGIWFLAAACAVVSGIQGFSFLYSRRKMDFYMGMPVKRKKRFWVIWLNGILVFLLPYLAGMAVSGCIALANGAVNGSVLLQLLQSSVLYLCFYLGVYHLTILAVMLTGNVIITCFGVAVFFLYELGIRILVQEYMSLYFRHFAYEGFSVIPALSPFGILYTYTEKLEAGQGNPYLAAVYLLLFAAAVGLISYVCYLKRPAEAAGHAMAFSVPKPYIKLLLTIPVTLLAGLAVGGMTGYSPFREESGFGFMVFSMVVVLIVGSCLIQVIYEFDIRGIFHKKRHILISAGAVAVIFAVFRFDLLGYDSYVPSAKQVTSAAIMVDNYGYYYGENYYDEEGNSISKGDYVREYMYLTEPGALCKLARISMDAVNARETLPVWGDSEEEGEWYPAQVIFRIGKNRKVCRTIYLNVADETTQTLLDEIMSGREYINGAYIGASDILDRMVADPQRKLEAYFGTPVYRQRVEKADVEELLKRYKKDIENTGFTRMRESIPAGSLLITLTEGDRSFRTFRDTEIRIYPFFTECISYLKEKGYYMEYNLNPEDVERIQVTNYHYELAEQKRKELEESGMLTEETAMEADVAIPVGVTQSGYYGSEELDFSEYVVYDDARTIEALSKCLYPSESVYRSFNLDKDSAEGIEVMVYFKAGTAVAKSYGTVASYCFLEDEVPEFVEKDTAYEQ